MIHKQYRPGPMYCSLSSWIVYLSSYAMLSASRRSIHFCRWRTVSMLYCCDWRFHKTSHSLFVYFITLSHVPVAGLMIKTLLTFISRHGEKKLFIQNFIKRNFTWRNNRSNVSVWQLTLSNNLIQFSNGSCIFVSYPLHHIVSIYFLTSLIVSNNVDAM